MTRRTLLQMLLGSSLQAAARADPLPRWRPRQAPRFYRTVGRNPRGAPVLSWQDALGYMRSHPKFWKDVNVLLPQGLEPAVREAYWPRVVQDVRDGVELAQAHHFMNGPCPVCAARGWDHCERAAELSHRFQRLAIPKGTQYLALTEGAEGRVTFNRIFIGDAIAYRVNVLEGRAFIDLIARCRNTALGQHEEWETYTAFTPPGQLTWETHTVFAPPPVLAAEGRAGAPAAARAEGGSVTINNYSTPPPMAYVGPGPAQYSTSSYQAGGVSLWFRQDVRVHVTQAAPTAVGAASGRTPPLSSLPPRTPLVVGPTAIQFPSAPTAVGSGVPVQRPIPAAAPPVAAPPAAAPPAASAPPAPAPPAPSPPALMQFPTQSPVQGPASPSQTPAQH